MTSAERNQHVAADGSGRMQKKKVAFSPSVEGGAGFLLLSSESRPDDTRQQTFNN